MHPGENPTVHRLLRQGQARRQATAGRAFPTPIAASGRTAEALEAARKAWASSDLSDDDEQSDLGSLSAQLHPRRSRPPYRRAAVRQEARRRSPLPDRCRAAERQAAFAARIAMQQEAPDAESRYRAVIGIVTTDAGLMMDRARYLRDHNFDEAARRPRRPLAPLRLQAGRPGALLRHAAPACERRGAATASGRPRLQHHLARSTMSFQPGATSPTSRSVFATITRASPGSAGASRSIACTSLGTRSPCSTATLSAGRSLQVQTKGDYWAGRAALAAGQFQTANNYFQQAAAYPELFYGQLALERLGRSVQAPPSGPAAICDDRRAARSVQ